MKIMLTKRALKNRENVKEVHSNRLGVSYTVTIRKYNTVTGERNTQLRRLMEQQYTKETLVSQKQYYKSYSHLRFNAVRSPQQLQRWNRLTNGTLNQERQTYKVKPFILNEPEPGLPNPTVFKAIHHLSYKSELQKYETSMEKLGLGFEERNKKKKKLPPLLPGTTGDLKNYYRQTYNINLFDYKVRRRFDVSSIPHYKYGYGRSVGLHQMYLRKCSQVIEDVTPSANAKPRFIISQKDRNIINDPNVYFRRP
ncbi:hypothetical protein RhiirA4_420081 [Rhizophagus irregularis]|uniref:Uncharacterized protein n=1 Tax=Rhizophagus irregularis TaxID=588596 RepID=A0A2I1GGI1_9GLOM|nr:hypothetical protein RhiirA4_420081 [Rhizophagus irregularis]